MQLRVVRAEQHALLATEALGDAVDALGQRSAVAQALSQAITSTALLATRAAQQQQQMLWLAQDDAGAVVGYLKTGVKHLFYVSREGAYCELDPLCVLDFYVDAASQRCGVGLQLFQRVLLDHDTAAARLAYDRPSPKLLAFLRKHAGLVHFFPQPNRFVVFDDFFHHDQ